MAFKKILVPLDGSELAEQALPFAETISKLQESDVILFAVSNPIIGDKKDRLLASYLENHAQKLLAKGLKTTTAMAHGDIAEEIIQYAEKHNVELIVISTHGYSGVKRWMLGSIAQKVLYGTCAPVLLVNSKSAELAKANFNKILLPLDGSPFSEIVFSYAEELSKGNNVDVIILQASESPVVPSYGSRPINPTWEKYRDTLWVELQKHTAEYLEKVKSGLSQKGMRVNSIIIKSEVGEVAENIVQAVQKEKVDLIIMATHGRTGVSRWVYGSVANRIVEESLQPILLIRPAIPVCD